MDTVRTILAAVFAIPAVVFGLYALAEFIRYVSYGGGWYMSRTLAGVLLFAVFAGLAQLVRPAD